MGIHQHYLYDPDDPAIVDLLEDMATKEVVDIGMSSFVFVCVRE